MGIKGLLPVLKPVEKAIVINEYAGQCVAVDGYGWLYRGAYGCAYDLAQGLQTTSYVKFFMHLVKMLLYNNVTPIIVFDGQRLPIKKPVHDLRKKNRKENYEKGVQFHEAKKNSQAEKYFRHAINITPDMVDKVIEALDEINVRHIVAPFEADSQMTYMFQKNQVQAVITEDSDLLVFGCSKVFYKLDRYGEGRQIVYDDIFQQSELGMGTFNREMFRYMCILAGCDYISSITDGNLKNARFIARKNRTFNGITRYFEYIMPKEADAYLKKFSKANAAFLYQFVFDIETQTYVRLNPLPEDIKVNDLVGLGDSPQNHDIPILQSNKARYIDPKLRNHLEKDPFVRLTEDEFDEFKFDDETIDQLESCLKKYETPPEPRKRANWQTTDVVATELHPENFIFNDTKAYPIKVPLPSKDRVKKEHVSNGNAHLPQRLTDFDEWKLMHGEALRPKRKNESENQHNYKFRKI